VPGDFDSDGDVDGNDFLVWQGGFGIPSGATSADGDADSDGDVDGNDFLIWQSNFGASAEGGTSHVTVPELATLPLGVACLIFAGLTVCRSWRRALDH
jgi:hypothetical protein